MNHIHLNLARKWRSKTFDELVGQDLPVKIMKNSLYRNFLFPVYLLSGTRGCGKTSMARIFAAALNCAELTHFQKAPQKVTIPCLLCPSCIAIKSGAHPDFIEIDAASHTGVDNIRSIIDASSFMPALGQKKIYLIDEAHMLSKAAFNALLKVLEEPPATALFILATTDYHKILPTVKSRCFQIFFQPINTEVLVKHLKYICHQEKLNYTDKALYLVALNSEGSARDALNLIERIRLISPTIHEEAVYTILQNVDSKKIYILFKAVITGSAQDVINIYKQSNFDNHGVQILWKKSVEFLRILLWAKHDVITSEFEFYSHEYIQELTSSCSLEDLINMLELCFSYELIFSKTAAPLVLFETMLIALNSFFSKKSLNNSLSDNSLSNFNLSNSNFSQVNVSSANIKHNIKDTQSLSQNTISCDKENKPRTNLKVPENKKAEYIEAKDLKISDITVPIEQTKESKIEKNTNNASTQALLDNINSSLNYQSNSQTNCQLDYRWQRFLERINTLNDQLLISLFEQSKFINYSNNTVKILLPGNLKFFKEWLDARCTLWQPLLNIVFKEDDLILVIQLEVIFDEEKVEDITSVSSNLDLSNPDLSKLASQKSFLLSKKSVIIEKNSSRELSIDTSMLDKLPKAQLIMRYFPGKVTRITDTKEVL